MTSSSDSKPTTSSDDNDVIAPDWMRALPANLRAKYVQAMLGVKKQVEQQVALGLTEAWNAAQRDRDERQQAERMLQHASERYEERRRKYETESTALINQVAAQQAQAEAEVRRCNDLAFEVDALYEVVDTLATDLVAMRMEHHYGLREGDPLYRDEYDREWDLLAQQQKAIFDRRWSYIKNASRKARAMNEKEEA